MSTRAARLLFDARISGVELTLRDGRLEVATSIPHAPIVEQVLHNSAALTDFLATADSASSDIPDVITCLERLAAAQPTHAALVDGDTVLSYGELKQQSDRIASQLVARGVGTETRVGLICRRGIEWIAALFGILKAGGAYVAVGTRVPPQTIAGYCASGRIDAVLGREAELASLDDFNLSRVTRLTLESLHAADVIAQTLAPATPLSPHQMAYVILTSGSTGPAKFVAIEHRALAHFAAWYAREYAIESNGCRSTQLATETFDGHILELMPYLCAGATVHLVHDTLRLDMPALTRYLRTHAITHCFLPTALAEAFVESHQPGSLPALRHLMTGGDVLRRPSPDDSFEMINLYGPTESTVVATHAYLPAGGAERLPPIGIAIGGTRVHVLDAELHPVPEGSTGELHLSGPHLARGYLDDPRETAERFIPNPWSANPGARMYCTGDLAREDRDGQLQYVGRKDRQLKVRGMRIEPGAVETTMLAAPGVTQAAVITHPGLPDALVGFCAFAESQQLADAVSDTYQWRALYDDVYRSPDTAMDDEFRGWAHSHDGHAIAPEEMQDWAAATVARVLASTPKPQHVLEIGCGTGILLTRLQPVVGSYDGIDLSAEALSFIRRRLAAAPEGAATSVRLFHLAAHELDQLPSTTYDTIIINSVTQYFPDAAYLRSILDAALARLQSHGTLFIGDVRDLRLNEVFASRVEYLRRGTLATARELLERAEHEARIEEELLLAPEFFRDWAASKTGVAEVLISPKLSVYDNEMVRFRYDVSITFCGDGMQKQPSMPLSLAWDACGRDLSAHLQQFAAADTDSLEILEIPHPPLHSDIARFELLRAHMHSDPYANELPALAGNNGIAPLDAVEACQRAGYMARPFIYGKAAGYFGLHVVRPGIPWPAPQQVVPHAALANNPGVQRIRRRQIGQLREHLVRSLPDYLVPSRLVLLTTFPMTSTDKLDRAALMAIPLPPEGRRAHSGALNRVEKLLCDWLSDALNLPHVTPQDNLFDLGGHSLLAMRLAAHVTETLGVECPLHDVLGEPNVAGIANRIQQRLDQSATAPTIAPLQA